MKPELGIKHELSLGEVISKTFEVYRPDFMKYFVLFAVVEVMGSAGYFHPKKVEDRKS